MNPLAAAARSTGTEQHMKNAGLKLAVLAASDKIKESAQSRAGIAQKAYQCGLQKVLKKMLC